MSRIADGLQKAKKEGVQSNPPEFVPDATAQFSFTRLSDIRIPWVLDVESNNAPAVVPVNVVDEPRRVEQPPRVDEPPKIVAWEDDAGAAGDVTGVFREKGSSVAAVLDPAFPRSWHEAVAIGQEIGSRLRRGMSVPSPEHLLFDDEGTLTFQSKNESGENPVVSLAVLLEWLLEGTNSPAALRQVGAENACAAPACPTVRSFSKALAPFERPDRKGDLLAVAKRLPPAVVARNSAPEPARGKIATVFRLLKKQ
jgi:hypothetical protein